MKNVKVTVSSGFALVLPIALFEAIVIPVSVGSIESKITEE